MHYVAQQTPISLIRNDGGAPEARVLDFVYEPILGDDREVTGIFVEGFDVTDSYRETIVHTVKHFTNQTISRDSIQDYKNQGGWNNDWLLSQKICHDLGIPDSRRVHELTDDEVLRIRELIDREHTVEGDLRRQVAMNIKRLTDLGSYRGLRHRKGLPVRGQRTQTNARTRKGPARPIAGKKMATK